MPPHANNSPTHARDPDTVPSLLSESCYRRHRRPTNNPRPELLKLTLTTRRPPRCVPPPRRGPAPTPSPTSPATRRHPAAANPPTPPPTSSRPGSGAAHGAARSPVLTPSRSTNLKDYSK